MASKEEVGLWNEPNKLAVTPTYDDNEETKPLLPGLKLKNENHHDEKRLPVSSAKSDRCSTEELDLDQTNILFCLSVSLHQLKWYVAPAKSLVRKRA